MKHNSQYFVNCLAWAKKSSIVVLPKISKQTAGKPTHNPISAQGMTCSAKSMQLLIWLWLLCYTRKWQKKYWANYGTIIYAQYVCSHFHFYHFIYFRSINFLFRILIEFYGLCKPPIFCMLTCEHKANKFYPQKWFKINVSR